MCILILDLLGLPCSSNSGLIDRYTHLRGQVQTGLTTDLAIFGGHVLRVPDDNDQG